jgi:hypothetical protein
VASYTHKKVTKNDFTLITFFLRIKSYLPSQEVTIYINMEKDYKEFNIRNTLKDMVSNHGFTPMECVINRSSGRGEIQSKLSTISTISCVVNGFDIHK